MGATKDPRRLTYGCLWPHHHPFRGFQQDFADEIKRASSGQLSVSLSAPLPESDLVAELLSGNIHMVSTSAVQPYVPEAGLSYLPYFYENIGHFSRVWNIDQSRVANRIAEHVQKRMNLKVLGWSIIGRRDLMTRIHPIREPRDLAGLRIRIDAPTTRAAFRALGAAPVKVPYLEVRNCLSSGAIDGAENAPLNMMLLGWHDYCEWVNLTEHTILSNLELVRLDVWTSLSSVDQAVFGDAIAAMTDRYREAEKKMREQALYHFRNAGIQLIPPEEIESHEFSKRTDPMIQRFVRLYSLQEECCLIARAKG